MDAIVLWQNLSTGLDGLQRFAKLVQVLSASWHVVEKLMSRKDKTKLKVESLRKDLLEIGQVLREAHFNIQENKLLCDSDFLGQELASVLAAVEKACCEPKWYELHVVTERASFVQERVMEKLRLLAEQAQLDEVANVDASALQHTLERMKAKAYLVDLALLELRGDGEDSVSRSHMPVRPICLQGTASADEYDSALESEDECVEISDSDEGYVTCDEEAFWNEARQYFASQGSGSGKAVVSSPRWKNAALPCYAGADDKCPSE